MAIRWLDEEANTPSQGSVEPEQSTQEPRESRLRFLDEPKPADKSLTRQQSASGGSAFQKQSSGIKWLDQPRQSTLSEQELQLDKEDRGWTDTLGGLAAMFTGGAQLGAGAPVREALNRFGMEATDLLATADPTGLAGLALGAERGQERMAEAVEGVEGGERVAMDLAGGAGNVLGFLPYAAGGWVLATGTGALAIADEFRQDAIANNATSEEQQAAANIGLAFGPAQALAGGAVLKGLRFVPGGRKLLGRISESGSQLGSLAGKAGNVLVGGAAEGLQEATTAWAQNLTASDWVGYDPEREEWADVVYQSGIGGASGAFASLLITSLGGRKGLRQESPENIARRHVEELAAEDENYTPKLTAEGPEAAAEAKFMQKAQDPDYWLPPDGPARDAYFEAVDQRNKSQLKLEELNEREPTGEDARDAVAFFRTRDDLDSKIRELHKDIPAMQDAQQLNQEKDREAVERTLKEIAADPGYRIPSFDGQQKLTSEAMQRLDSDVEWSVDGLQSILNKGGVSKQEQTAIGRVQAWMTDEGLDRVPAKYVKREIQRQMVPLRTVKASSQRWAKYGVSNVKGPEPDALNWAAVVEEGERLGLTVERDRYGDTYISDATTGREIPFESLTPEQQGFVDQTFDMHTRPRKAPASVSSPETFVFEAPVRTLHDLHKMGSSNYAGHIRVGEVSDGKVILELQSDLFQESRGSRESRQEIEEAGTLDIEDARDRGLSLAGSPTAAGTMGRDFRSQKGAEVFRASAQSTGIQESFGNNWPRALMRQFFSDQGAGRYYFPSPEAAALVQGWQQGTDGYVAGTKKYKELNKWLKQEFKAQEVERNGEKWLQIDIDEAYAGFGVDPFSRRVDYTTRDGNLQPVKLQPEHRSPEHFLKDYAEQNFARTSPETRQKLTVAKAIAKVKTLGAGGNHRLPPSGNIDWNGSFRQFEKDQNSFNEWMDLTYTLEQIGDRYKNVEPIQRYVREMRERWYTQVNYGAVVENEIVGLKKMGGKSLDRTFGFLQDLTVLSQENDHWFNHAEIRELAAWGKVRIRKGKKDERTVRLQGGTAKRLDGQEVDAALEIQSRLEDAREKMRELAIAQVMRAVGEENPNVQEQRVKEVNELYDELGRKNYFPISRFGDFTVTVRDANNKVVHFEQLQSEKEQKKVLGNLRKRFSPESHTFSALKRTDAESHDGVVFDTQMAERVANKLQEVGELTKEQRQELMNLVIEMSPTQSFAKHQKQRQLTPGFSKDALRSYADYINRFAVFYSRTKHKAAMDDAVKDLEVYTEQEARRAGSQGKTANDMARLRDWVKRHYSYMNEPQKEWAILRTVITNWNLGFWNIRAAYMNFSQTPLYTYPWLAKRFGDVKAGGALARATTKVRALTKALREAEEAAGNPDKTPKLTAGQIAIIKKLAERGLINQGLAVNLAMFQEEGAAAAVGGVKGTVSGGYKSFTQSSMKWFQVTEQVNRKIAALAATDLYLDGRKWEDLSQAEQNDAMEFASDAVRDTQFEYARYNRPEFLRGRKGSAFAFFSHPVNAVRFLKEDKGGWRALLAQLIAAGGLGLPFIENLLDLIDAGGTAATRLMEFFGYGSTQKVDTRRVLREGLVHMMDTVQGERPWVSSPWVADMLLDGAGKEMHLNPSLLLSVLGAPPSAVDLSGSLSMGRLVPGTETLRRLSYGGENADALLAGALQDLAGAGGGLAYGMLRGLSEGKGDAMLPTSIRALKRTVDTIVQGEFQRSDGSSMREVDFDHPQQLGELLNGALGFRSTQMARMQDAEWANYEQTAFWEARRRVQTARIYEASQRGSAEALDKANAMAVEFNKVAPAWARLDRDAIINSANQRARREGMMEQTGGRTRRQAAAMQETKEIYPGVNYPAAKQNRQTADEVEEILPKGR